jgi:hypothetical protein
MTVKHTAGIFTGAAYGDRLCASRAGERVSHGAHHVNNDRTCARGGRGTCDITAPINSEPIQRADQHSAISVPTNVRQYLPSTRPTCGESGAVDSLLCDLCAHELAALFNNIDKILRCAERVKVRKPPNKANGQSPWLVPEVEELAAVHVPNYKQ